MACVGDGAGDSATRHQLFQFFYSPSDQPRQSLAVLEHQQSLLLAFESCLASDLGAWRPRVRHGEAAGTSFPLQLLSVLLLFLK